MRLCLLCAAAALLTGVRAGAQEKARLLKPHQPEPGKTVVMRAVSDSPNAAMTITRGASSQKGRMSIKRERTIERSLRGSGATTQLVYKVLADQLASSIELGASKDSESTSGALVGQSVLGFRDSVGRWRLFLESGTAQNKQAAELAELEAYENRRWFQSHPVSVGQTWAIDPSFIRHVTERDLGKATVNATMTFQSIEQIDGAETAVLTFRVESLGGKSNPSSEGAALADLRGTIHVDLATMLDKKLIMTGTLTTIARQPGQSTEVILPINHVVTKTVR